MKQYVGRITDRALADMEEYIRFFNTIPHDDYNPENTCYCVSWCSDDHRRMTAYPFREERRAMAAGYFLCHK